MPAFPILAAALKSSIILAAAALVALALGRRSAAARHLVWTAASAALLALTLLSGRLPALRLPATPGGPMVVFRVFVTGQATSASRAATSLTEPGPGGAPSGSAQGRSGSTRFSWVPALWLAGAAVSLLQIAAAWLVIRRMRRAAHPFDDRVGAAELGRSLGIAGHVEILETARGSMPMTCGVFRPAVLMPAGAAEWSPERQRIVLLHELAHVRRGDVAAHLLARAALGLYWWNPLAWFAWRQFVRERERATDDLVLAAGERASDYAGHLLEIARAFQPAPATAWAALAMARRSQLEGRLVAILDSRVDRRPAGRRAALAASLAAVLLAAPFAAMEAQDPAVPPEVEPTIRAAISQKNYAMLDQAAAAYEKIGRQDVAEKLLEQSLAVRTAKDGNGSPAEQAGLVKLGQLAAIRGEVESARSYYTAAANLGDRPEIAPALLFLGQRALIAGDRSAATSYFERVLNVDPKGPQAGPALTWMANIERDQFPGSKTATEDLYQRAIAVEDPKSLDLADTLTNYANFLRRRGRAVEAQLQDARAALARQIASAGPAAHPLPPPHPNVEVPRRPGVYRVGNGVRAPSLLLKTEPGYTEEARAAKIQGTVLVYVEVNPQGKATNMRVLRSLEPGLDRKALEAIEQWKFAPGKKDGVPVTVAATIEVNFRLL